MYPSFLGLLVASNDFKIGLFLGTRLDDLGRSNDVRDLLRPDFGVESLSDCLRCSFYRSAIICRIGPLNQGWH